MLSSEIRRGMVLTVHLSDGSSAAGRLVRVGREFLHLTEHRLEAAGVMHELRSKRLLIPRRLVKAIEVVGS